MLEWELRWNGQEVGDVAKLLGQGGQPETFAAFFVTTRCGLHVGKGLRRNGQEVGDCRQIVGQHAIKLTYPHNKANALGPLAPHATNLSSKSLRPTPLESHQCPIVELW